MLAHGSKPYMGPIVLALPSQKGMNFPAPFFMDCFVASLCQGTGRKGLESPFVVHLCLVAVIIADHLLEPLARVRLDHLQAGEVALGEGM